MRAYAVFAGGGAKGAALAGCLQCAQDQGIEFVGFGGASAGSIVALLAAAGYTGSEIKEIFLATPLLTLLDDGGAEFSDTRAKCEQAAAQFSDGMFGTLMGCGTAAVLLSKYWKSSGIDSGERLREFLATKVAERLGLDIPVVRAMSFEARPSQMLPLKTVASDITKGLPVVFPRDHENASIIDAISASAAFPFLFKPVNISDRLLLDGGLASNLPCFLFAEDSKQSRLPTFAIDLHLPEDEPTELGLISLGKRVLSTCLGASDALIREVSDRLFHISVTLPRADVPTYVSTLDLGAPPALLAALYNAGYTAMGGALSAYEPLCISRRHGLSVRDQLMVQYGNPKLYEPVLAALARDIEVRSEAKDVRANIMLSTGRGTRILVYHHGMEGASDVGLELAEDAGCSGTAWANQSPAIADLEQAAANPGLWKMTVEEHEKVPISRKSMISVPIPGRSGEFGTHPIGTLSVDSITPLADTDWRNAEGIDSDIVGVLIGWAYVVAQILP